MIRNLRRFALGRTLFPPTTLADAIDRLGFVQADPIRAPARAQDLILRHRVRDYRAGDLDRAYADLDVEEDVFINYGYVPAAVHALMHPRRRGSTPPVPRNVRERNLLAFLRQRGRAHPREVDRRFAHGRVTNYWGGLSRATTRLLEDMHYRGLVRIVGRERGVRIYAPRDSTRAGSVTTRHDRLDALVDVVVNAYAPLPLASLRVVIARLRYAVPHWQSDLRRALARARARLSHQTIDGVDWFWPAGEPVPADAPPQPVRLLAPFDPAVWDRRRFEMLWGWAYRFEAYTPAAKRRFGYYALPMVWRDDVVGWANVGVEGGALDTQFGFIRSRPRDHAFKRELAEEVDRLRAFLG